MSFLAPWILAFGAAAAAAVVAIHLLTTRRPPTAPLPTARFVPEAEARAVSRAARPTDLLLLALRLLAVAALALAFARPLLDAPGPSVRAVVALEWTTAVADVEAARHAAREQLGEGAALVVFDTAARIVPVDALDSLSSPSVRRASWSPALVAAGDAAAQIARGADSLRLVLVGTSRRDALDAATATLRAAWPGRVEFVELRAGRDSTRGLRAGLRSSMRDDPLAPALAAWSRRRGSHPLRVTRDAPGPADSAWARGTTGAVLVHWPARGEGTVVRPDGVVAFGSEAASVVAPLIRVPLGDSAAAESAMGSGQGGAATSRSIARWRDGTIAATERALGAGCAKTVGVGLPIEGDLTLRQPFAEFLDVVLAPCGGDVAPALPDSTLEWLRGPDHLASAQQLLPLRADASPLAAWLLLLAALALVTEQLLRRRTEAKA